MKIDNLSNESIQTISEEVEIFLVNHKVDSKEIIRIKFSTEEILLRYQEHLGTNAQVEINCKKNWRDMHIEFSVKGESINLLEQESDENSEVLDLLLASMGLTPVWKYKNGLNKITYVKPISKNSPLTRLFVAITLGVIFGFLFQTFPELAQSDILNNVINPISDAFIGILSTIATPLLIVFLIWRIFTVKEVAIKNKMNQKIMKQFILGTAVIGFVYLVNVVISLQFDLSLSLNEISLAFLNSVLSMMPSGSVLNSSTMQFIFISIILGIAIILTEKKSELPIKLIEQTSSILQTITSGIYLFVPIFIFINVFEIVSNNDLEMLKLTGKIFGYVLVAQIILLAIYVVHASMKSKISIKKYIKLIRPTFLIALRTASSSSTFSNNLLSMERKMKISKKVTSFGIPIGQVLFKPSVIIIFITSNLCLASYQNIDIDIQWLITMFILSFVFTIVTPAISGGSVVFYTIMFTQLGLPLTLLALVVTIDVILDFIATAVDTACLQSELVVIGNSEKDA